MTIKIYKPSKSSMQSGQRNTKKWLAEYISDVDNIITTEIFWSAVILDTSQLDEDYPLGQVIFFRVFFEL